MEKRINPKRLVEQSYDQITGRYDAWAVQARGDERERYTSILFDRLPAGAAVLELGCGAGSAVTVRLAGRFNLTGVDLSARQLDLARRRIPGAAFIQADMAALDFPPASFDAVVAFYSIIHVPREEHARLLRRIAGWLRPDGLLVATMGAGSTEAGYEDDWFGAPMYWSHFDSGTNRRLVKEAGLEILTAQEETADEHGKPATFLWVIARLNPAFAFGG